MLVFPLPLPAPMTECPDPCARVTGLSGTWWPLPSFRVTVMVDEAIPSARTLVGVAAAVELPAGQAAGGWGLAAAAGFALATAGGPTGTRAVPTVMLSWLSLAV